MIYVVSIVLLLVACIAILYSDDIIAWLRKLFHREPPRIEIHTIWGLVTESARKQAASNIRENPVLRQKVEDMLAEQAGSREEGIREMRRRYPEVFNEEEK